MQIGGFETTHGVHKTRRKVARRDRIGLYLRLLKPEYGIHARVLTRILEHSSYTDTAIAIISGVAL